MIASLPGAFYLPSILTAIDKAKTASRPPRRSGENRGGLKTIHNMKSSKTFWQAVFIIGLFLSLLAFYQTIQQGNAMGIAILRSKWVFLLGLYLLVAVGCGFALAQLRGEREQRILSRLEVEVSSPESCGGLRVR